MATSPSDELRIVAITDFTRSGEDGQWYWHTQSPNGDIIGDGSQGYDRLNKAVNGFFAQQGVDPVELRSLPPEKQHYSKMIKVTNSVWHIRKYAYGAPEPYEYE